MKMITAAIAFLFSFQPVNAASLTVGGTWGQATPNGTANGLGTSKITWGQQFENYGLSSYNFAPNSPTSPNANENFLLGTFTHDNQPIYEPWLTSATLNVKITGNISGSPFETLLNFNFAHNETPNVGWPLCCDDIVSLSNNPSVQSLLKIGDITYFLTFYGYFSSTADKLTPLGAFKTVENFSNNAYLFGSYSLVQTPVPAALPLFASGLAGLGLLGWFRKRRRIEL